MNRRTPLLAELLHRCSALRLYLCVVLLTLLSGLSATAQLSMPIPDGLVSELSDAATALRSATTPYTLEATARTATTSGLRQAEESASSGLRLLELPAVEYRQLPDEKLWGNWITTATGAPAWRGVLQLEESGWNTLYFVDYQLKRGDMLLITSEEGEVRGAFTEANNGASRTLTTAPLYGERIAIYYYPASSEEVGGELPWRLEGITTALLSSIGDDLPPAKGGDRKPGAPWFTVKGLECTDATVRHPEVSRIARSELQLVVRGRFFSSGTLINNSRQDGDALVLTAAHCLNNSYQNRALDYVRQSAEQTVFFFQYASPTGDPLINGSLEQSLAGAELVAFNEEHDMCLLRITGVRPDVPQGQCAIPPSYRPYFAGWNAERDFPAPVVGIHHPRTSVQRYNRADEKPPLESYDMSFVPVRWVDSHLHIKRWDAGTTAVGSSGSGLFDKNHHLVGALTGGSSSCGSPINDYYYALSEVFTGYPDDKCLKPYLAPTSDQTVLEGLNPFISIPPVRLSHQLYSLMRDSVLVRIADGSTMGVAVRYDIDTSVQYLGTMAVLGAMDAWQPLELAIYSATDGRPDKQIYKQQLQAPQYNWFDKGVERSGERSLTDAFETFIPVEGTDPVTLPAGRYYIALETTDASTPLKAPLLLSKLQSHEEPYAWHRIGTSWEPAQLGGAPYLGHYWIDPIVAGHIKDQGTDPSLSPDDTPRVILAGERLFILLPKSWSSGAEPVQLELFASSGQRLLVTTLLYGNASLLLTDYALGRGVYIVNLTGGGERYSCKLLIP